MRKYGRTDGNQTDIVSALRKAGCSVQSLASVGNGCPDLLVARCGRIWLMEAKNDSLPPSRQKLTEDEIEWINRWNAPVHVVHNVDEALKTVL